MRYIEPQIIVKNRFSNEEKPLFDVAVFIFRDKKSSDFIKEVLKCKEYSKKVLWGISAENTHIIEHSDKKVLIIEQLLWGGPQASILLEELPQFGVKEVIGIGACGSIGNNIRKNDIVIDVCANCTDGTSKYYTKNANTKPSDRLLQHFRMLNLKEAFSSTVDAIYQEQEDIIQNFRINKSNIVNMESAPFYACSQYCSLDALWIGCVSDTLYENEWDDWFDSEVATKKTAKIVKDYLENTIS